MSETFIQIDGSSPSEAADYINGRSLESLRFEEGFCDSGIVHHLERGCNIDDEFVVVRNNLSDGHIIHKDNDVNIVYLDQGSISRFNRQVLYMFAELMRISALPYFMHDGYYLEAVFTISNDLYNTVMEYLNNPSSIFLYETMDIDCQNTVRQNSLVVFAEMLYVDAMMIDTKNLSNYLVAGSVFRSMRNVYYHGDVNKMRSIVDKLYMKNATIV